MHLDLGEEETSALLDLLTKTIENDRYPLSPRIQTLRGILTKFRPMAPAPPPPARPPTAVERDPNRGPRDGIGDRPPPTARGAIRPLGGGAAPLCRSHRSCNLAAQLWTDGLAELQRMQSHTSGPPLAADVSSHAVMSFGRGRGERVNRRR
jgi:hypothetical protein